MGQEDIKPGIRKQEIKINRDAMENLDIDEETAVKIVISAETGKWKSLNELGIILGAMDLDPSDYVSAIQRLNPVVEAKHAGGLAWNIEIRRRETPLSIVK